MRDAEYAECVSALRKRVRRSLDDPRPSLTTDEAEVEIEKAKRELGKAR